LRFTGPQDILKPPGSAQRVGVASGRAIFRACSKSFASMSPSRQYMAFLHSWQDRRGMTKIYSLILRWLKAGPVFAAEKEFALAGAGRFQGKISLRDEINEKTRLMPGALFS
jgi:hypothetical protein